MPEGIDKKLYIDVTVTVSDGKYKITIPQRGGELKSLRYKKPWGDLTGDNLVYCMATELQEQKECIDKVKAAIKDAEELIYDRDNNLTDGAICIAALKDIKRYITKK